jgi:hypothetical protein
MFDELLDHRCDIYHLIDGKKTAGYGIKTNYISEHEENPSLTDVPCHFHNSQSNFLRIEQSTPYSRLSGETKLTLPVGTDIRKNDMIRDCGTGMKYRADMPKTIRGHHISVTVRREDGLKGAI